MAAAAIAKPSSADDAVGWLVSVFWQGEKQWFKGCVTRKVKTGQIEVEYDDGDVETVVLGVDKVKFIRPMTFSEQRVQEAMKLHGPDSVVAALARKAKQMAGEDDFAPQVFKLLEARGLNVVDVLAKAVIGGPVAAKMAGADKASKVDDDEELEESVDELSRTQTSMLSEVTAATDEEDEDDHDDEDDDEDDDEEDEEDEDEELDETQESLEESADSSVRKSRNKIAIKWVYGDQIRKAELNRRSAFEVVLKRLQDEYAGPLMVQYQDDEGDMITIKSQSDWDLALKHFQNAKKRGDTSEYFRVYLSSPQVDEAGMPVRPASVFGSTAESVMSRGGRMSVTRRTAGSMASSQRPFSRSGMSVLPNNTMNMASRAQLQTMFSVSNEDDSMDDGHVAARPISRLGGGQQVEFDLPPRTPDAITHWQRGDLLGSGSYGAVYSAMNLATGELMAVKQVHLSESGVGGKQTEALEREIQLLQELDHPNVIRYLGTQRTPTKLYIFLELAAEGSVASKLKQFGPFTEAVIRRYTAFVLEGLAYLHEYGIVHRDIKSSNLLLHNGIVKLADFGCSKKVLTDGGSVELHTAVGTTQYMAPEVMAEGSSYGPKADIWSLGMTVLEMATGSPPWANPAHAVYKICMTQDTPPIPEFLSPEAHAFLEKCFKRNPKDRPSAKQLLQHPFLEPALDPAMFRVTARTTVAMGSTAGSEPASQVKSEIEITSPRPDADGAGVHKASEDSGGWGDAPSLPPPDMPTWQRDGDDAGMPPTPAGGGTNHAPWNRTSVVRDGSGTDRTSVLFASEL